MQENSLIRSWEMKWKHIQNWKNSHSFALFCWRLLAFRFLPRTHFSHDLSRLWEHVPSTVVPVVTSRLRCALPRWCTSSSCSRLIVCWFAGSAVPHTLIPSTIFDGCRWFFRPFAKGWANTCAMPQEQSCLVSPWCGGVFWWPLLHLMLIIMMLGLELMG